MASGVAIYAPDFPNIHHFVKETQTGYLFKENNIKKKLAEIFANKSVLLKKKINGPLAIREKFNWELEEKKLITFYGALENKKR